MGLVKKILTKMIQELVWLMSYLFPRKKDRWVFGAWFGNTYAGNSKYLFEYMLANHPEIECVWITKNKVLAKQMSRKQNNVYYYLSFQGVLYALTAGVACISCSSSDINAPAIQTSFKVNLWHGTPMKKIMYDDTLFCDRNRLFNKISRFIFPFLKGNFDMIASTSELVQKIYSSAFLSPITNIPITGYPQNDKLSKNDLNSHLSRMKVKAKLNVLYAPTHRGEGRGGKIINVLPTNKIWQMINDYFLKRNSFLHIRLHYYDRKNLPDDFASFSHVKLDLSSDPMDALLNADILITDYSSIYFDYLLLNRPVIFAPFDYEEYIVNDRHFYLDYDKITIGPKAKNWRDVLKYIDDYLNNHNLYEQERNDVNKRFNFYSDGENCKRITSEICDRIGYCRH